MKITSDVSTKDFANALNLSLGEVDSLSDITSNLNDSVLAYVTSFYINKLRNSDPEEFKRLAVFMLGSDSCGVEKNTAQDNKKVSEKQKHEFHVGDVVFINSVSTGWLKYSIVTVNDSSIKLRRNEPILSHLPITLVGSKEELYRDHGKCLYIVGYGGDRS